MAEVHVSPNSTYLGIFGALMVLTGLTYWVSTIELGVFNDVVALSIALTKATLVVLFFMHAKYAGRLVQIIIVASLVAMIILFAMTIMDYLSREHVVADPAPVISMPEP